MYLRVRCLTHVRCDARWRFFWDWKCDTSFVEVVIGANYEVWWNVASWCLWGVKTLHSGAKKSDRIRRSEMTRRSFHLKSFIFKLESVILMIEEQILNLSRSVQRSNLFISSRRLIVMDQERADNSFTEMMCSYFWYPWICVKSIRRFFNRRQNERSSSMSDDKFSSSCFYTDVSRLS